jgi:hypothetical protein
MSSWNAIQKHLSARGGKKPTNDVPPNLSKAKILHNFDEKRPRKALVISSFRRRRGLFY